MWNAVIGSILCLVFAFVIFLFTSMNIIIALMALASLIGVISSEFATFYLMGW